VSLILDALRKAESERERETVPGLNTQPIPPLSLEIPEPVRRKSWLWLALGLGATLLVAVTWLLASRDSARPAERMAAAESTMASAPAAPAAPAPAPVPPPNALTPEPAREVAAPAPWPQETRKRPAKASDNTQQVAVAPSDAPPVYTREQLPENIRATLPPLAVSGSIYSSMAANRSLILDGRLLRENDQVTSDLVLEEIRLKTAVLRIHGYRFEIRY